MVSDDGTVDLSWSSEDGGEFELEQSTTADFSQPLRRYLGPDTASVLTGLREGTYHFRVRAVSPDEGAGAWSEPLTLEVEFMDRGTLFVLLGTGFVVAAASIGAIVTGFLRTK